MDTTRLQAGPITNALRFAALRLAHPNLTSGIHGAYDKWSDRAYSAAKKVAVERGYMRRDPGDLIELLTKPETIDPPGILDAMASKNPTDLINILEDESLPLTDRATIFASLTTTRAVNVITYWESKYYLNHPPYEANHLPFSDRATALLKEIKDGKFIAAICTSLPGNMEMKKSFLFCDQDRAPGIIRLLDPVLAVNLLSSASRNEYHREAEEKKSAEVLSQMPAEALDLLGKIRALNQEDPQGGRLSAQAIIRTMAPTNLAKALQADLKARIEPWMVTFERRLGPLELRRAPDFSDICRELPEIFTILPNEDIIRVLGLLDAQISNEQFEFALAVFRLMPFEQRESLYILPQARDRESKTFQRAVATLDKELLEQESTRGYPKQRLIAGRQRPYSTEVFTAEARYLARLMARDASGRFDIRTALKQCLSGTSEKCSQGLAELAGYFPEEMLYDLFREFLLGHNISNSVLGKSLSLMQRDDAATILFRLARYQGDISCSCTRHSEMEAEIAFAKSIWSFLEDCDFTFSSIILLYIYYQDSKYLSKYPRSHHREVPLLGELLIGSVIPADKVKEILPFASALIDSLQKKATPPPPQQTYQRMLPPPLLTVRAEILGGFISALKRMVDHDDTPTELRAKVANDVLLQQTAQVTVKR